MDRTIPEQPASNASAEEIQIGKERYHLHCAVCHGALVKSSGVIKDLRLMQPETHKIFKEIVLGGVYAELGMASFADLLKDTDIQYLHAYIVSRANEDRDAARAESESMLSE